ncbi:MAG: HlyC/CorC family transporter [Oscillospiraceae bacterium]|nr:HlyC/CorC family transporter [Oscillospiraceae bacterium]
MTSFYIVASLVCLALSAFFSASEMALSSASRLRLSSLAEDGSRGAKAALRLIDHFDDALSAILIGNNFVNIALSSLASVIAIATFGEQYAWLATVIVTVSVIILGETIPKILAKKNANRMLPAVAPLLRGLSVLLKPLTSLTVALVRLVTRPFPGERADAEDPDAAVEELQSIIETAEDEDVLDTDRSELVQAALDFDEISASEVMTSRVDMDAIDIGDDWDTIYNALCVSTHSRLPVYEDSIDNIIGVLHLNRFFKAMLNRRRPNLRRMLMKPCFVYKSTKLPAVLDQLREARQHLAVVTDEYGGVCGIVSMEDVLEEIVGDIWDETDEIDPEVVERPDGAFEVDGDMSIADFTELLGLSEDEFETESSTAGGWALERFGSFPKAGSSFVWENFTVTVLAMDGLRVEKLLVKKVAPERTAP